MKKADFIVIAVVALVVGVLVLVLYGFNDGSGKYAQVELDGRVVDILPLDKDCSRHYTADDKGGNTLVICDGKAEITQADCPDGICKRHSAISRTGESIICLPHKLVVTIVNNIDNEAEIDAIA